MNEEKKKNPLMYDSKYKDRSYKLAAKSKKWSIQSLRIKAREMLNKTEYAILSKDNTSES